MSTLLAVELHSDHLSFVKADASQGSVRILATKRFEFAESLGLDDDPEMRVSGDDPENSLDISRDSRAESASLVENIQQSLRDMVGDDEVDSAFAVLDPRTVLSETISLPFREQRKIDQTAALQLEDLLPFELEPFVIDSLVIERESNGQYRILSTIAPKADLGRVLDGMKSAGVEARVVSTPASTLIGLQYLFPMDLTGDYLLLGFHADGCSCLIARDRQILELRELLIEDGSVDYRSAIRDIQLLLERYEHRGGTKIDKIFAVGVEEPAERVLTEIFGIPVKRLVLSDVVGGETGGLSLDGFANSVALFAGFENKQRFVDFRKGEFAYKAQLRQVISAFEDYAAYFVWGAALFLAWYLSTFILNQRVLARINNEIERVVTVAEPGLVLPQNQEVSSLLVKVEDLEAQLEGMGSISTLSPLDLLLTISQSVSPQLDVQVDSMNVAVQRVSFAGSVGENIMLGRLAGALENQRKRFCSVKVDPKGRVPGTNRVRFVADIQLCEGG